MYRGLFLWIFIVNHKSFPEVNGKRGYRDEIYIGICKQNYKKLLTSKKSVTCLRKILYTKS